MHFVFKTFLYVQIGIFLCELESILESRNHTEENNL